MTEDDIDLSGKAILIFDRYTEADELHSALYGWKYKVAFDDVWEKLFRPRHKWGYNQKAITELLTSDSEKVVDENGEISFDGPCNRLMEELEKLYGEVRRDNFEE